MQKIVQCVHKETEPDGVMATVFGPMMTAMKQRVHIVNWIANTLYDFPTDVINH